MSAAMPVARELESDPASAAVTMSARIPQLDGLRGIAIALVMAFHFQWIAVGFNLFPRSNLALVRWIVNVLFSGWMGVDLFFTLSGFLITGLLADARQRPGYFRNFYIRRALRIVPAYYLLLACWPLMDRLFPTYIVARTDPHYQRWLWTYTANFLLADRGWSSLPFPLIHVWSLAIEEQFYLFWPLLILWLDRRKAIIACVAMTILSPLLRAVLVAHSTAPGPDQLWMPCKLDALAAGALVALLIRQPGGADRGLKWIGWITAAAGLLLATMFHLRGGLHSNDSWVATVGLLALAVLSAGLIRLAVEQQGAVTLKRLLRNGALRWLGKYSYGLYLWHMPVCVYLYKSGFMGMLARAYMPRSVAVFEVLIYAVPMLGTAFAALLSWHLCERPFLALKRRFPSGGAADGDSVTDRAA